MISTSKEIRRVSKEIEKLLLLANKEYVRIETGKLLHYLHKHHGCRYANQVIRDLNLHVVNLKFYCPLVASIQPK